jgi:hypothetical protein
VSQISLSDAYAILGVNKYNTHNEIRIAYKRLMKCHHPDTGDGDREVLQAVQEAYILLKDNKKYSGSSLNQLITVPVSEHELAEMLGKKCQIKDDNQPEIVYTVKIPYSTRIGDTVIVKNIVKDTNLKIKFKGK